MPFFLKMYIQLQDAKEQNVKYFVCDGLHEKLIQAFVFIQIKY